MTLHTMHSDFVLQDMQGKLYSSLGQAVLKTTKNKYYSTLARDSNFGTLSRIIDIMSYDSV